MATKNMVMVDGNTAVAAVAHAVSEVIAIYPITPSSTMGEVADELSTNGVKNIWGTVPSVVEMQSEGGAAGAVHGALTSGALSTTFTASQGLLLMIPNMYKLAGELTSTVFHVSARSLACQGLSIFGDHSDVMSVRQTGFAELASSSVQEASDMALIAHAATLESRIPFLHFFDGFRTSHEVQKVEEISREIIREMISDELVIAHRQRGLTPDKPVLRGTAQNPDVYFQGRETVNKFYAATPAIVQKCMDKFAKITGRQYKLFDYVGAPDAKMVIVIMGSGADTTHETIEHLVAKNKKVGVLKVRLFRPFDTKAFALALPPTVRSIAVLDRTKEPGSVGEPLYSDVRTAIGEAMHEKWMTAKKYPVVVGGRYGLGSKEFTPAMVKAVFDNLASPEPKNHFTVGINDDVTGTSLTVDNSFQLKHKDRFECMFYGLGSDGTVGANKNSIKIIGTDTEMYAQGYFVYDSKKAGSMTVSHLRFGPELVRSPYLCTKADFVACHNFSFLEKYDMLANAKPGAVFLLESPYTADEVWSHIPDETAKQIIDKKIKLYVIDAMKLAKDLGLGARINTLMQTCFFTISGVLPKEQAIESLKKAARKTYGKKGEEVVQMNFKAIDAAVAALNKVRYPSTPSGKVKMPPTVAEDSPEFVRNVTAAIMRQQGDKLPVSAIPNDGTWPTATTQYEKRNIAGEIPVWDTSLCIQCAQCSLVCPHAAIRTKVFPPAKLAGAPATFKTVDAKGGKEYEGMKFCVQVAPEDCTGCGACVDNCPGRERDKETKQETGKRAIMMREQIPLRKTEAENFKFFLGIPDLDPKLYNKSTVKGSQLTTPLFEFSGACAGCGETAYIKLLTQLFGDRLMISNATGCSSIYGGNLPTTPYCKRSDGRGPSWSNSLFEDNAEFGYGMRLAVDKFKGYALELLDKAINGECGAIDKDLLNAIKSADQSSQVAIEEQRARVAKLKEALAKSGSDISKQLHSVADYLVKKSVWILGGDGWAYDIGYGGLDHVLASGRNIKILVLDTEVYSNTGGQASKSTPMGAVAQFAASGKPVMKKDLAMISMTYGNIYVATVSLGSNPNQVVKAFAEAEAYDGPALIIAYSHCIAHGINMTKGLLEQKDAVNSGHFPLYRYNPMLTKEGKNPFSLDSKLPTMKFSEHALKENRFKVLMASKPETAKKLLEQADKMVVAKYDLLQKLAAMEPCQTTSAAPAQ